MKKGNIFWGILLLTLGILLALRNFDIIFFTWHSIFRLWPLIFIFWGIAILPIKSGFKLILSTIAVLLAILIIVRHPVDKYHWWWPDNFTYRYDRDNEEEDVYDDENVWQDQNFSEALDSNILTARLNLNAAIGNFYIQDETEDLFEFKSEGDAGPYEVLTSQDNSLANIDINHKKPRVTHGDLRNDAWLSLNTSPIWKVNVDVGAANLEMDLSHFKVEKVDLDGGASKINLKLGDNYNNTHVTIDAGATSIEIKIPYESACELHTSTFLSARDIDGFNKIKDGVYQTSNFSDSVNQISIDIEAAVSSFRISRY